MCRKDTDNAHLLLMLIDLLFVYALAQVYYFGTAGKKVSLSTVATKSRLLLSFSPRHFEGLLKRAR